MHFAKVYPKMKRTHLAALVFLNIMSSVAYANPSRTPTRSRRNRFDRTLLVGVSTGIGSPSGFGGVFVEMRFARAFGLSIGGGAGGAFGPAVHVGTVFTPLGGTSWAIGAEGYFSRQFSYARDVGIPGGRVMPAGSNWLSLGAVTEFRPTRTTMLRVGAGYSWLTNTSDFGILSREEINYVAANYTTFPGKTPLDAARASLASETLGVWYVHIDFAPTWRW
jgi:hypothetical protein